MKGKHKNTREYCLNTLQILKDFDIHLTKEEKKKGKGEAARPGRKGCCRGSSEGREEGILPS